PTRPASPRRRRRSIRLRSTWAPSRRAPSLGRTPGPPSPALDAAFLPRCPHVRERRPMDLVTQAVLGAAIGEAGWGKKLGAGAMCAGALLGMTPDLDIISGLAGQWASLIHHRGVSHSLLFAPLV